MNSPLSIFVIEVRGNLLKQYFFIPDFKEAYSGYRDAKRRLNNERAKLNRLIKKYSFVDEIVNPNVDDFELEQFVKNLFSDLGYAAKVPDEKADFDVIAKLNKDALGIEVKNSTGVKENELFQAKKYAGRHKAGTGAVIHPIVVWNNSKSNQKFGKNNITDAENHDYSIITTQELLKGYTRVKSGQISIESFHAMMMKPGIIEFSSKKIRAVES